MRRKAAKTMQSKTREKSINSEKLCRLSEYHGLFCESKRTEDVPKYDFSRAHRLYKIRKMKLILVPNAYGKQKYP